MKNEISAAIIGAGSIVDYHINGYVKSGAKLVAIADTNKKAAESKGKQKGIPKVFVNYSEMLEECPEVDAISICTPNFLHAKIAVDCLKAGRNVFCEKPPALNARDTAIMKQEAEKSGKILMFDFNNRARPDVQALFEYVKTGQVGKICASSMDPTLRYPWFRGLVHTKSSVWWRASDRSFAYDRFGAVFHGFPRPGMGLVRDFP